MKNLADELAASPKIPAHFAYEEKRRQARELRAQGLTHRVIAERLQVGQNTISSWLQGQPRGGK